MKAALTIPGVCVDRKEFLSSTLNDALSPDEISKVLALRPAAVIKRSVIDNLATRLIKYHARAVTTLSTLTTSLFLHKSLHTYMAFQTL